MDHEDHATESAALAASAAATAAQRISAIHGSARLPSVWLLCDSTIPPFLEPHSHLSATIGSTRVARQAGM